MNRVIKFRAFVNGEMIGADCLAFEEYGILADQLGAEPCLMQYIGKDKDGVETYEGDIVSSITGFDICNSYHEESFEREVIGVVSLTTSKGAVLNRPKYRESNEGDYLPDLEFKKFSYAYSFAMSNSRVLGNIYENPELIK